MHNWTPCGRTYVILQVRRQRIGAGARRIAARLALCLVVALQLGAAASACPSETRPRIDPELAALASAVGQPVALCHEAAGGDDQPLRAAHNSCCECGLCGATADGPPAAPSVYVKIHIAEPAGPARSPPTFGLAVAPQIAATSPRGPPLDV